MIYDYGITSWSSAAYGPYGNEMEWGGGIAPLMVTIDDYCYTQLKNVYDENKKLVRTSRLRTFTTNPVTNITFPNGRTVLYTKVMERVFSNSGKEKRTIYYYREPHVNPFTCLLYDRITEGSVSENLDFEVRYAYCMAEGTFFPNRKKLYGSSDQYPPFPYDTYVGNWYYKSTGKLYKKEEYTEDRLTYKEEYQYPDRVGQDLPAGAVELFPIEGYNAGHVVWKTNWHQSVIAIANSPYLQDWVDGQKIYDRVNIVVDQAGYMPYTKKTMTRYFSDGSSVVTTEDHGYKASQMHLNPSTIVTTASNGQKQTDVFGYAQVGPNLYKLANHLRKIGEKAVYTFAVFEGLRIKSITKQILLDGDNIYEIGEPVVQASYEYHDGNITNVKQIGQPETGYIWSYKSQYPIAKLVDIPYDAYRHLAVALCNTMPTSSDFNAIKNLQAAYPGAQITTYQYKPLAGITSISDPSGRNSKFVYDEGGKLRLVKDMEDRKITEYEYRLAKYKKTGGSPVIIPPLIISFQHYQDQAPFILNSRVNEFHVDVIAGSGNYKCKWEIEATGTDTGSTVKYVHPANIVNDNRISLSVPSGANYGRATVTCTVSDTGSNEQKTESFWFYYSIQ